MITFNNKCGCRCDFRILEKAFLWYSKNWRPRTLNIYSSNGYQEIAYQKGPRNSIRVHRLIALYLYGYRIEKLVVHHKNENRLDNRLRNLDVITRGRHNIIHHLGKKHKKA